MLCLLVVLAGACIPGPPASALEPSCAGSISAYSEESCVLAFQGFPIVMDADFVPVPGAEPKPEWELHMEVLLRIANVDRPIEAECSSTGDGALTCHAVSRPGGPALPSAPPGSVVVMRCIAHLHDLIRVSGVYGEGTFGCTSGGVA